MNRKPYSSYHGRKTLGQRILMAIAVLLIVVLLLAVVAWIALPNSKYVVYTADGMQFNLPFLGWGKRGEAEPQPSADASAGEEEPDFIIEEPDVSAAPSIQSGEVDLRFYERRDVPKGLVSVEPGKSPARGQGAILDMTGELLDGNGDLASDRADAREENAELDYAAAWLAPDWEEAMEDDGFAENLIRRCLLLADMGYDEILFSEAVPKGDGADLAQLYRDVKEAMEEAKWEGRLGLVLDQSLVGAKYDDDLMPAIAQSFDRLYFRRAMQNNVKSALDAGGFSTAPSDIVTVYTAVPNVTWVWAVLPQ